MNRKDILFTGIDVYKDTHAAVRLSSFGEKVFEMQIGNEAEDFVSLVEKTKIEADKAGFIPSFGLEDVHSWGGRLSSFLSEEGLPVVSVAPILVDHNRSKMTHPEKSDSLDAQEVAKVMIQKIDTLPIYSLTDSYSFASDTQHRIQDEIQKFVLSQSSTILEIKHSEKYGYDIETKNETSCSSPA